MRPPLAGESRREPHADKEAVEKYLPALGPLVQAHWATSHDGEAEGRSLLPSPDFVITAVLRLQPGKVAAVTADGGFVASDMGVNHLSGFEKGVSDFLPPSAQWVHSNAFDEKVLSKFEGGQCHLDRGTDTVFVRAVRYDRFRDRAPDHGSRSWADA
jgi:hypothetical protein